MTSAFSLCRDSASAVCLPRFAQQRRRAPTVKFTATSQLVVETVTVKDKSGNPSRA